MEQSLSEEAVSPELSTLALQRKFHGTRKYSTNPSNRYKELTEVVLEYKKKPTSKALEQILRLTEKLIFTVMRQYNMFTLFPETVTEDVFSDCQTFVLMKCLDTFDPTKKAAFSTHYTWWLKSHMNYKRDYHNRRQDLYSAIPINGYPDPDDACWHEGRAQVQDVPTFSMNTMCRVKRLVAENFKE